MARSKHLILLVPVLLLSSCVMQRPNPPAITTDLRLSVERCPVHDSLLIEATNSVDLERGSIMPCYYKVRDALFPCAFDDPSSHGEMAKVTYCEKCRAAKRKYFRDGNAMTAQEFSDLDVDEFIESQRRELDEEYLKELLQ